MNIALTVVHVAACLVLVLVVLLQTGKGADMGAVFGGSSQTLFGSSGAGNFLTRLTTGAAIVFMLTSLTLSYLSSASLKSSLFDSSGPPPVEAPAGDVPPLNEAPAPGAAAPAGEEGARVEIPAQPAPAAEAPAAPAAEAPPAAEPQAAAPAAEAPAAAPN